MSAHERVACLNLFEIHPPAAERNLAVLFLELLVGEAIDAPVGDGRRAHRHIDGKQRFAGGEHRLGGFDLRARYTRRRIERDRPRHERRLRAELGKRRSDGVALLAARAIGDEAYRVDGLVRRTGGD